MVMSSVVSVCQSVLRGVPCNLLKLVHMGDPPASYLHTDPQPCPSLPLSTWESEWLAFDGRAFLLKCQQDCCVPEKNLLR